MAVAKLAAVLLGAVCLKAAAAFVAGVLLGEDANKSSLREDSYDH
ncbi:hypothetical protein SNOG_06143 [Parastagonospora nodorum SN15]|uniref:Uncharacterized protein n=1 Tax=Phaeosphaeria nodorum (strain SN15 / ATCC MYA-4574 / FGSC 10173) TaxID=321614 RepID=Q0UQ21_PHANO|nr:hypothetical protein SNOG_06143 [Parastagonospora nodorum SN15]EAT85974.1 hypothetical protein SNOG_06143 [Parastagonospora nodorum SN15]